VIPTTLHIKSKLKNKKKRGGKKIKKKPPIFQKGVGGKILKSYSLSLYRV
jgi:hypothetical protein